MDRGDQPQHGHSGHHDGKACTAAGDQHLHAADEHDLEIGYREELAHPVYAGADLLVVPSVFEPCGLAPMTAMRYGTVPVVRAVGGMTDTVFDRDYSAGTSAAVLGAEFTDPDGNLWLLQEVDRTAPAWPGSPVPGSV